MTAANKFTTGGFPREPRFSGIGSSPVSVRDPESQGFTGRPAHPHSGLIPMPLGLATLQKPAWRLGDFNRRCADRRLSARLGLRIQRPDREAANAPGLRFSLNISARRRQLRERLFSRFSGPFPRPDGVGLGRGPKAPPGAPRGGA